MRGYVGRLIDVGALGSRPITPSAGATQNLPASTRRRTPPCMWRKRFWRGPFLWQPATSATRVALVAAQFAPDVLAGPILPAAGNECNSSRARRGPVRPGRSGGAHSSSSRQRVQLESRSSRASPPRTFWRGPFFQQPATSATRVALVAGQSAPDVLAGGDVRRGPPGKHVGHGQPGARQGWPGRRRGRGRFGRFGRARANAWGDGGRAETLGERPDTPNEDARASGEQDTRGDRGPGGHVRRERPGPVRANTSARAVWPAASARAARARPGGHVRPGRFRPPRSARAAGRTRLAGRFGPARSARAAWPVRAEGSSRGGWAPSGRTRLAREGWARVDAFGKRGLGPVGRTPSSERAEPRWEDTFGRPSRSCRMCRPKPPEPNVSARTGPIPLLPNVSARTGPGPLSPNVPAQTARGKRVRPAGARAVLAEGLTLSGGLSRHGRTRWLGRVAGPPPLARAVWAGTFGESGLGRDGRLRPAEGAEPNVSAVPGQAALAPARTGRSAPDEPIMPGPSRRTCLSHAKRIQPGPWPGRCPRRLMGKPVPSGTTRPAGLADTFVPGALSPNRAGQNRLSQTCPPGRGPPSLRTCPPGARSVLRRAGTAHQRVARPPLATCGRIPSGQTLRPTVPCRTCWPKPPEPNVSARTGPIPLLPKVPARTGPSRSRRMCRAKPPEPNVSARKGPGRVLTNVPAKTARAKRVHPDGAQPSLAERAGQNRLSQTCPPGRGPSLSCQTCPPGRGPVVS